MQVGQPQLFEVRDALAHPLQVAGEQVDIQHPTQHVVGLEPIGSLLAHGVQGFQVLGTLQPGLRHAQQQLLQVIEKVILLAVQVVQQAEQTREIGQQAGLKSFPGLRCRLNFAPKMDLQTWQQPFQADLHGPVDGQFVGHTITPQFHYAG